MSLVARFWNPDGYEMPALYHDERGFACTWNWRMFLDGTKVEVVDAELFLDACEFSPLGLLPDPIPRG